LFFIFSLTPKKEVPPQYEEKRTGPLLRSTYYLPAQQKRLNIPNNRYLTSGFWGPGYIVALSAPRAANRFFGMGQQVVGKWVRFVIF
jgi:hypothetical protein